MNETTLLRRDGFRLTFEEPDTFRLYDTSKEWGAIDTCGTPVFETQVELPTAATSGIDSDDSARARLAFWSARPGDVGSDYFDENSPRQLAWRDLRAETLGSIALEIGQCWEESARNADGRPDYALSISLSDDGTLDTVVSVYDPMTGQSRDESFSEVEREENGAITNGGWSEICETVQVDHFDYRDEILNPPRSTYRNGDSIGLAWNGCDGCSPSMIQGVFCHETGCPDAWRDAESEV